MKKLLGFLGGLSASWWRSGHNRHHAMPNRLHRDIDLATLPLLVYNTKVVKSPEKAQGFLIKYQAKKTSYPVSSSIIPKEKFFHSGILIPDNFDYDRRIILVLVLSS